MIFRVVNEGTQHGIAAQNHSPSDAPKADFAVSIRSPSNISISDVGVTTPSIATSLETSDTQGSRIRDPSVFITVSWPKSLIESDPVKFATEADQGVGVSGATTSPKASSNPSSISFANGSSDHDGVNAHDGNNDYVVTPKSYGGQYPSNEDTTEQRASV